MIIFILITQLIYNIDNAEFENVTFVYDLSEKTIFIKLDELFIDGFE